MNGSPSVAALFLLLISGAITGQAQAKVNNPYAPSPAGNPPAHLSPLPRVEIAAVRVDRATENGINVRSVSYEITGKPANLSAPASLTSLYKIDTDDILLIKVGSSATHYTVKSDGTIDFPLAHEEVNVKGLTADQLKKNLKSLIRLFNEPHIEVSVADYASHTITVVGLVKDPGKKNLRREAVPLFAIKAEALVQPEANSVKVTREGDEAAVYPLSDPKTDSILVLPGMSLEFGVGDFGPPALYYVASGPTKTSERELSGKTTLSIAASEFPKARKATIHRRSQGGKVKSRDYDLRAIGTGKAVDPTIEPGDVIRIHN